MVADPKIPLHDSHLLFRKTNLIMAKRPKRKNTPDAPFAHFVAVLNRLLSASSGLFPSESARRELRKAFWLNQNEVRIVASERLHEIHAARRHADSIFPVPTILSTKVRDRPRAPPERVIRVLS